ncbi:unnamed protein product [Periconia digitata]|uniref:Uncharacterized protein n=1 Tax=Periconia digitata TaxID=1303443 RepID=A0A9W4UD03_9PLEO|nr:unnamed protein product [Periconia digitata]
MGMKLAPQPHRFKTHFLLGRIIKTSATELFCLLFRSILHKVICMKRPSAIDIIQRSDMYHHQRKKGVTTEQRDSINAINVWTIHVKLPSLAKYREARPLHTTAQVALSFKYPPRSIATPPFPFEHSSPKMIIKKSRMNNSSIMSSHTPHMNIKLKRENTVSVQKSTAWQTAGPIQSRQKTRF